MAVSPTPSGGLWSTTLIGHLPDGRFALDTSAIGAGGRGRALQSIAMDPAPLSPRRRLARAAAIVAALLGLASAGISAHWALGGTWLLDTVGGEIERWGRQADWSVAVALWAITTLKAGVALAAPAVAGLPHSLPPWTRGRIPRILTWIAAGVLTLYGGVLTVAGLLVQASVVDIGEVSDPTALAWHAYFWDPWFLGWGLTLVACLWLSRPRRVRRPG